ncbi:MAG: 2-oxoglutarate oxidoreductase [Candidatus Marinimicrobia bacterium]|jgi:2-oxoglutarate ferredoxin oxidoreductase subunit beta|nr:2-oxoglutarate oxidoreductase [Candidatus Neomarinimicrobiota bacterium]MBT3634095.1 2-oxoglutarate oxidoreductase [Candidatus Neomarinimicrobiota bacterium]MBT3683031.1 2-oxoglutarate oxidoreductase [Candidatus Neomarinimicrobiota bacterium]MBT3759877.1 2-oxoglutarate oxidoreductase [Candidatus Neomarinimicrobiota bacterium]MBT3895670.1 2-oxoglutarate oxidoreductase [Candidatus Neomarinimicrobiota bacterium]
MSDPILEGVQCELLNEMNTVWEKTDSLMDTPMHYCPGCGHSVVHRLIMEVVDELDIRGKTVGVAPVGCSVFAYNYLNVDMQQAAHGRATAVATGIKRVLPDRIVFTYQGDGDLAAIGTGETIHTINRGENIVIIFINNGIYGMTGGQMAPTTLVGGKTSTSVFGRDTSTHGYPLRIAEMIAPLPGAYYVTRQAVISAKHVRKTKKALTIAFKNQIEGKGGVSFVEVISNCPSGWKMTPLQSNKWLEDEIFSFYELGDIKVPAKIKKPEITSTEQ